MSDTEKIKIVVVNNFQFGYIYPNTPETFNIQAETVGGYSTTQLPSARPLYQSDKIRLANRQDLETFRIHESLFNHEDEFLFEK